MISEGILFIRAYENGKIPIADFEKELRFKSIHHLSLSLMITLNLSLIPLGFLTYKEINPYIGKLKSILLTITGAVLLSYLTLKIPIIKEHLSLAAQLQTKYEPIINFRFSPKLISIVLG